MQQARPQGGKLEIPSWVPLFPAFPPPTDPVSPACCPYPPFMLVPEPTGPPPISWGLPVHHFPTSLRSIVNKIFLNFFTSPFCKMNFINLKKPKCQDHKSFLFIFKAIKHNLICLVLQYFVNFFSNFWVKCQNQFHFKFDKKIF